MSKEKNVIEFYVLCSRLKNMIRTGWKNWQVKKERVESVAEHIYGTLMLAIAVYYEYGYKCELKKVLFMLAVHEMEEILIGDLTMFDIKRDEKEKLGHKAISEILKDIKGKNEIESLILEFDERKTDEAKFAYFCDKFEADIQAKLYDEQGCVDVHNLKLNNALKNEEVQNYLKTQKSWSEMWLVFGRERYAYDENFLKLSKYVQTHKISDCKKNKE